MEKEKQRIADSTATANRLIEEALLAERLAQEKEKARLAAAEKAKLDAENARKQQIENDINALGHAHFALNSSYLRGDALKVLDGLIRILENNPNVELQISSHTDSRGSEGYNKGLSQRRVENTKAYLIKQGIESSRLITKAYGEEKLLNDCGDGVYCPESKHKLNRRSEFLVLEF